MNTPVAQHIIPRLHLQHFTGILPKGHIWTYDKRTGTMRSSIPEETAFENHFYSVEKPDGTMDTTIEKYLSDVESKAAPTYEALLRGIIPSKEQARADFATFLALMYTRTKAMRRTKADMYGQLLQVQSYALGAHPKAFDNFIKKYEKDTGIVLSAEKKEAARQGMIDPSGFIFEVPKEITLQALTAADELAPILFNMRWSLLQAEHGFFITTDNPLVREVDPKTRSPMYGDGGFLNKTAEIIFPLSPKLLLFLAWEKQSIGIKPSRREYVDAINKSLASRADQFLYSHISHKSILRLAAQFKDSRTGMTLRGFGPKKFAEVKVRRRRKRQE